MLTVYGTKVQGFSHEATNTVCQDNYSYKSIRVGGRDFVIAAVADGVGSCSHSHYGSQIAVASSLEIIEDNLEKCAGFCDENILDLLEFSFSCALEDIEEKAAELQIDPFEFCTTLTVAIYDGFNLWFGHSGDSGLVALLSNRQCKMLTERQKGELANEVKPLQSGPDIWMFSVAENAISAFALMTDGILDYLVENELYGNAVYYPFFNQLFAAEKNLDEKDKHLDENLFDYLSSASVRSANAVTDDISMVIVSNSETVGEALITDWDEDGWNVIQKEKKARINDALYGSSARGSNNYADKAPVNKANAPGGTAPPPPSAGSNNPYLTKNGGNYRGASYGNLGSAQSTPKNTMFSGKIRNKAKAAVDFFFDGVESICGRDPKGDDRDKQNNLSGSTEKDGADSTGGTENKPK